MNEQWTPSTEQVRQGYAIDPEFEYSDPINYPAMQREAERAFDRWLAGVIRQAQAEAWYEGYWVGIRGTDDPGNIDNPYKEDN